MKLLPSNKNSIALTLVACMVITFFVAGLLKILDYPIVKAFLLLSLGALFITGVIFMIKNEVKKNRPEDKLQDDSH